MIIFQYLCLKDYKSAWEKRRNYVMDVVDKLDQIFNGAHKIIAIIQVESKIA